MNILREVRSEVMDACLKIGIENHEGLQAWHKRQLIETSGKEFDFKALVARAAGILPPVRIYRKATQIFVLWRNPNAPFTRFERATGLCCL